MKDYKEDISNESLAMTHEGADETTHEMINQVTIPSTLKTEIKNILNNCRSNNRSLIFSFLAVAIISCLLTFSVSQLFNYAYLSTVSTKQSYSPMIRIETSPKNTSQNQSSTPANNEELTQSEIEQLLKYYFDASTNKENAL